MHLPEKALLYKSIAIRLYWQLASTDYQLLLAIDFSEFPEFSKLVPAFRIRQNLDLKLWVKVLSREQFYY